MKKKTQLSDFDVLERKKKKPKHNPKLDPLRKNKKAYLMNPYKEYT